MVYGITLVHEVHEGILNGVRVNISPGRCKKMDSFLLGFNLKELLLSHASKLEIQSEIIELFRIGELK